MSKYSDKLKHPKWQMKRLEIFSRDKFRCCLCHNKEMELHVHHLYYLPDTDPWNYDNDCYVTLCDDCHNAYHFEFSKIIGLIAYSVIKKGKSFFDVKQHLDLL
jgi:5-methylcytosine-specific restriction endonuclease McrA